MHPAIVLYDAHCGICRKAYDRASPLGRPGLLHWVPNDSLEGLAILEPRDLVTTSDDTMIVVVGGKVYLRSAAVVQMAKRLRAPYNLLGPLVWVVPKPVRDWQYKRIAARRSRECALPAR